jgi:hypothetical protein
VYAQVLEEIADIAKAHLIKLYKHTNMHIIYELWMLRTFIGSSYTSK